MNAFFLTKEGRKRMTGSVQFARDKRAIVQWNFIYILETWNPLSHCKQDSCNCEQDNMSSHSVFPSTDRQETVTNPTFFVCFVLFFVRVDSLFFFFNKVIQYQVCGLWTLLWPIKSHIPQVERQSGRHGLLTEICTSEHSLSLQRLVTWISQVFRKECDAHC